jgi:hypothetical protein
MRTGFQLGALPSEVGTSSASTETSSLKSRTQPSAASLANPTLSLPPTVVSCELQAKQMTALPTQNFIIAFCQEDAGAEVGLFQSKRLMIRAIQTDRMHGRLRFHIDKQDFVVSSIIDRQLCVIGLWVHQEAFRDL